MSADAGCLCTWIGYRVQHRDCPVHPIEWVASDEPFVIPDASETVQTPITPIGTPVVTLGFTREETEAMEAAAFPEPIESWLHGLVSAVLSGEVDYKHRFADEPSGDASRAASVEKGTS